MPNTTLAGHPLHPQLIAAPAGLLPFSFVMDVMHCVTGRKSYADAAYYTMLGGYIGGLGAGAAGAADYLTIPSDSHVKKIANLHGGMNLAIMGMYSLNLLLRRGRQSPGVLPVLLSGVGTAGLLVSQWYGGHMVYEHGMRVKGVASHDRAAELKPPGDERLERAFIEAGEALAPADKVESP